MEPIIQIRNVGKKYQIRHFQGKYIALRDVLMTVIKSPFQFAKKKIKTAAGIGTKEEFWALKDVNLDVMAGEIIGIIGRNGAGKSTLLKILTGITPPSTGEIKMHGRVASLLEVGTGFHPELTGKENIFLNGAILGMKRKEIARKFDDIVAFSGVEKFLDTPVKYYSSGMYVRLAFSVAAHMEPDILLVDEVLAVGDAEFQKKCLGKMEEVTKQTGRTILFVSHNLGAIQSLCKKCLLIDKGEIKAFGKTHDIINLYTSGITNSGKTSWQGNIGDDDARLIQTYVRSRDGASGEFKTSEDIEVGIEVEILQPVRNLILGFILFSEFDTELAYSLYDDDKKSIAPIVEPGKYLKKFIIPKNTLAQGDYRIDVDLGIHGVKRIVQDYGGLGFTVINIDGPGVRFPVGTGRGRSALFRPLWAKGNDK